MSVLLTDSMILFKIMKKILDWFSDTDEGQITESLILIIIAVVFAIKLDEGISLLFLFAAFVNFLRLLKVVLKIFIIELRKFWRSTKLD